MAAKHSVEELKKDFEGAELGDARRSARLVRVVESIAEEPGLGFPQALGSRAELEAFYRFLNNDSFDATAVFKPHRTATLARASAAQEDVVVIHDTTAVEFRGDGTRTGMGYTSAVGRQGFLAHASLCLGAESGLPLGVGQLQTFTRTKKGKRGKKPPILNNDGEEIRESARWLGGVEAIEMAGLRGRAIHLMDAEADFFELFSRLKDDGSRFVIRAGQLERLVLEDEDGDDDEFLHLCEAVDALKPAVYRQIWLNERKVNVKTAGSNGRRQHPARRAREATVAIAATTLALGKKNRPNIDRFAINVVRVWETSPPLGEPPVSWILFTSEPVATKAAMERVVDLYRRRWLIEDFFKALKTGCSLERRQIESYDGFCKVLAILAPIACQLLWLRGMDRLCPNEPAEIIFTESELEILHRAPATRGMPKAKTVGDAIRLLARLGGHLKNNGAPGWITLGRGYEKLLLLRIGWQMAMASLEEM
jgi:hypothetical protein